MHRSRKRFLYRIIVVLMHMGCKIYLNTVIDVGFFSKDLGCALLDAAQISNQEFAAFSEEDVLLNRNRIREKYNVEESIRDWKTI